MAQQVLHSQVQVQVQVLQNNCTWVVYNSNTSTKYYISAIIYEKCTMEYFCKTSDLFPNQMYMDGYNNTNTNENL